MADRIYKLHRPNDSILMDAKFGEIGTCPIDQAPSKDFNIDPLTGRPMSDLTALLKAKDGEAERIIKEMQQYKADYLPADISNEDALKYYQPRLCQMPSELAELQQYQVEQQLKAEQEKQREKELESLKAEIIDSDKKKDEETKS